MEGGFSLARLPRRFLDAWSIPHLLFGVTTATVAPVLGIPGRAMFWVTFALAVLWEVFEMYIKIRERLDNIIADILLPLLAFWPATVLAARIGDDPDHRLALFVTAFLVYIFTNLIAWRARLNHERGFMN